DITGTHTYTYDDLHRLISATHPPGSNIQTKNEFFDYDGVGNRTADANLTAYQYDAANRLLENSSFTYTHDANGNMTGTSDKLTLQATSYAYDSENQLKQVSLPGGPVFAAKYDGLGRRIEKSTGAAAGQTTRYIYDAEDIVAMLDGNNGRVAVFTHGPGIDEPLMMRRTDGQEFFMHADGLGSIVAHADGAGGVVERLEFEAYGKCVFLENGGAFAIANRSLTGSPFAFTSREFDSEVGSAYHRARYFDPRIGRFLKEDPLGDSLPAMNRFVYALNNPANLRDSLGLIFEKVPQWSNPAEVAFRHHSKTYLINFLIAEKRHSLVYLQAKSLTMGEPFFGHRYVINSYSPNEVIDMKHFMAASISPGSELFGLAKEIGQWWRGEPSGFDSQDFLSNALGVQFREFMRANPNLSYRVAMMEFFRRRGANCR
ncbi:MAG: RHS repeat-associated core domain-containing protein, partial [Bdellovibrionota bacterium]